MRRGLFRFEAGPNLWWACVQEDDGGRVNVQRRRYEDMAIEPPFEELPIKGGDSDLVSQFRAA